VRQAEFAKKEGEFDYVGKNLRLSGVEVGQAAPEIEAKGRDGKAIKLSSLKGKVVLVNFTATWCAPCKKQLPDLLKLYKAYQNKGLQIVSVFLDKDRPAVERHIKENKITWPFECDGKGWDSAVGREWGVSSIPTDAIIDKNGVVVEDDADRANLQASVEKYLK
jgi:thiol-disulfide isomerase/thioredoxin